MQYVTLSTGAQVPQSGSGIYQIPEKETERTASLAIKIGYRHIDTAQYYRNEVGIGQTIKASGLPRENFFIITQLAASGYRVTKAQIARALKNLRTDYIDLMLIHWVVSNYEGTYQASQETHQAGQLRATSLSDFNQEQIKGILAKFSMRPAMLQNEIHVSQQQVAMRRFCHKSDIQFESRVSSGEGKESIFNHPLLTTIGSQYHKIAAQAILRFLLREGVVAISKSVNSERMKENFEVSGFRLSAKDMEAIRQFDRGHGLSGWNE